MYEIFTAGRFEVEPGNEEAFVDAWSEFAASGRFVSLGQWEDADAVRAWKSSASSRSGSAAW